MRIVGPLLFAEIALDEVLEVRFDGIARDAVYDVCAATSRVSKLRLKRAIIDAAQFGEGVKLGMPTAITMREVTNYGNVEASCSIPFTGDPQLLLLSAPGWPRLRAVRGQACENVIRLEAQAGGPFVRWLPTLFAAEIEAIGRHLSAQSEVVRRYHGNLELRVRNLVDRIYPNLDPARLRDADQAVLHQVLRPGRRERAWAKLLEAPTTT